jgi:hypothetical protein
VVSETTLTYQVYVTPILAIAGKDVPPGPGQPRRTVALGPVGKGLNGPKTRGLNMPPSPTLRPERRL